MSDDDRWEKAEQLDVLHDKLEELRGENAALRARLEKVEWERVALLERADVTAWPFCARCLIRWDVRRYQVCPTCVMDTANETLDERLAALTALVEQMEGALRSFEEISLGPGAFGVRFDFAAREKALAALTKAREKGVIG